MASISVKHYSLLDYVATIKPTDPNLAIVAVLGGSQSYLGRITVEQDVDNITKTTDATGSTVYSFSNDLSGTISFEISFVAGAVETLLSFVKSRYNNNPNLWKEATFTIDITKAGEAGQPVISCMHCMLKKRPNWSVEKDVGMRTYEFFVARIEERTIEDLTMSTSTTSNE